MYGTCTDVMSCVVATKLTRLGGMSLSPFGSDDAAWTTVVLRLPHMHAGYFE
jgi:hypothetical protein